MQVLKVLNCLQHVDKRLSEENERLLHYLYPVIESQPIYTVKKIGLCCDGNKEATEEKLR